MANDSGHDRCDLHHGVPTVAGGHTDSDTSFAKEQTRVGASGVATDWRWEKPDSPTLVAVLRTGGLVLCTVRDRGTGLVYRRNAGEAVSVRLRRVNSELRLRASDSHRTP